MTAPEVLRFAALGVAQDVGRVVPLLAQFIAAGRWGQVALLAALHHTDR